MSQNFIFDKIVITIDMGESLSGGTSPEILYKKPDKTIGAWVGQVSGTKISYTVQQNEIDLPGQWQFSGRILLGGKRKTSDISVLWFDKPLDA